MLSKLKNLKTLATIFAFFLAILFILNSGLLSISLKNSHAAASSSKGVCLSVPVHDCGSFTCSGYYSIAVNGICGLKSGYCESDDGSKIKQHDCSTLLW